MDVPFIPEPRQIYHCRKDAYAALEMLEHYADAIGVDPAFNLAEIFLECAGEHACEDCRRFLGEVHHLMQVREYADQYDLFILHDDKPEEKEA